MASRYEQLGRRGDGRLPAEPTDAPRGSMAKMKVMHQRLLRGETLFHPDDNPAAGDVDPFRDNAMHSNTWHHGTPTGLED